MNYGIILFLFQFVHAIRSNAVSVSVDSDEASFSDDYCWRDLNDKIPLHAIAGGLDKDGRGVYIGQILYQDKLIPGVVLANTRKIYFEWGMHEYSGDQNVKVLTSMNPANFQWIKTNNSDVLRLKKYKTLIVGGFEPNYSTYIGRVEKNGVTEIGKIICNTNDCLGMYSGNNGAAAHYGHYQILTYNPLQEANDISNVE